VLLLSMPWEQLEYPSIQLGILSSVLERAGITAETRSVKLDFMEHCASRTAGLPDGERLSVRSYRGVLEWSLDVSLGDWIFSKAPEGPYLEFVRSEGVPEEVIAAALHFRALVPSFLDALTDELAADSPAIVGFTTAFNQTLASLALATKLRERLGDSVHMVFGGANCAGPMGAALHRAFPVIDVVVRGEGELVLPDLVRDLLDDRPVRPQPGLCYRDPDDGRRQVVVAEAPGDVRLDEVPMPRYDEYFERLGRTSFGAGIEVKVLYESARGCWWGERSHCAFCGISDLAMPYRAKSPERVVSELVELAERHGRLDFFFVDYILSRTYYDEVLPELRDGGYDFRIFCETKANLREDQVRLLREAGFTAVQAGVESLSTPILKLMRKGVSALQNIRLLKWCAQYGVRLYWNVLYGTPGEAPEEYERLVDLIPSLTHLEPPRLIPLQLDRFSPHFEAPSEFGIIPLGARRGLRFVYPVEHVDDETLQEIGYSFDFRYADGRDPEAYTAAFRDAVREWQASGRKAIGTLRYRRGPGFIAISDGRPGLEPAQYRLGETEARIYLACENGATVEQAWGSATSRGNGASDLAAEEVEEFLEELTALRLACRVDGRYLALALPPAVREGARATRSRPRALALQG
jgi:ribosomal peptide maturation radical SAM protein 1